MPRPEHRAALAAFTATPPAPATKPGWRICKVCDGHLFFDMPRWDSRALTVVIDTIPCVTCVDGLEACNAD